MPAWVAYLAIAVALVLSVLMLISRKRAAARLAGLERHLEDERARANGLASAEGQLQAIRESLRKAELEAGQYQNNLNTALADKSSVETKLELLTTRRLEIEAERDSARREVDSLQENLQQEKLRASRAESTLESTLSANNEFKLRAERAEQERDEAKEILRLKSIDLAERTAERDQAVELATQAKRKRTRAPSNNVFRSGQQGV